MSNRHDITLDLDRIATVAAEESGCTMAEVSGLEDRVRRVVDAYLALPLDNTGRAVAAETILDILVTRLKLASDRQRHPELAQERITKPVVVAGFPRSGTTLLYSLMAADPGARSPHWWDTLHPSPPPGLSPEHNALRRQIAQREIAEFLQVVPIKSAHNFFVNGADMDLECYVLWGLDFRSLAPFLYFRAPGYPQPVVGGFNAQELIDTYRFEKQLLQSLQWRRQTGHWVLKDPAHHFYLPEMQNIFPDATFVWTHRDPVQVFASVVELMAIMTSSMTRRPVDRKTIAKSVLPMYVGGLDRILRHPIVDSQNVIHVAYDDMTRDSIKLAREIYGRMGKEFLPQIMKRIEEYRANPNNRPDLYGRFQYHLEDTGFSAAELREHFKPYIQKFDIRATLGST